MTPLGYHSIHCHHDDNHPNLLHHIHMSHGVNLPPAAADAGGHSGGGGGSGRGRMPNFFFGPPDDHSKMAFEPAMLHPSASFSSSAAGGGATQAEEVEARGAAQALYMQQQQAQDQEESAAALEEELMVQVEGYVDKKGRRLGFEQVKALEKAFEVENRLEPERKARLAGQLGLQPRQVAVWFQNRRARWKTKQMERDFGALRSKFEALKADRDKLLSEKEQLQAELNRLKDSEIKEGQHTMQTPLEGQALNSPVTLVASCSVNTDHETGAVVELQDEHGSNNTTIAPLSFQVDQVMAEEPTKTMTLSTITTNPHGVASHLFRVQQFHTLRMEHNESLSSTEEYNSDDGGAIVDSPTSNTSLIRMNEVDHNIGISLISNDHQHTLFNNHMRITPNPCQQLAHVKPNIINIKNEASWEGDQLHHPDANNCVHLINLPSEWYNW